MAPTRPGLRDVLRVDIVIVTFDPAPGMLEAAVRSILEHTPDTDRSESTVHVIDNGVRAAALLESATWMERPLADAVRITTNPDNVGFGAAMNVGIDRARVDGADVVVLLNDDIVVTAGWIGPILDELADASVGAVQPLLVSHDGETINSAGVDIDDFGAGHDRLRGQPRETAGPSATDIEVFTGGAVALSRSFLDDVGGFDERFFLYYEDVDLARRGTSKGWRYRLAPGSIVHHRGSATTAVMGPEVVLLRERNRLWSVAMHGSPAELAAALWLSIRRLRHRPRRIHARALAQGVAGTWPRLADRIGGSLPGVSIARRVSSRLRSVPARRRARRMVATPGVNVVGYHHISSGLGSNARELSAALRAAGVPVVEIDNDLSASPRRRPARAIPDTLHDTTIAIVTAFEFEHFVARFPQLVGGGKRMIAYWVWELEDVPAEHVRAARLADEIWTPTNFVRDAYARVLGERTQIRVAPFRMEEPTPPAAERERWRLQWGDSVVFLVSFDYLSIVERKNPLGAIAAFRRAFDGSSDAVRLIVKSINGHERPDDFAEVMAACGDDDRIEIIDRHLDDDAHHGLIGAADVLVSLHRSEGYGLHPAIAMWLGTPVIATGYSGVMDFMDDDVAAMVDYERVPVTNGQGIYPDTAEWAEPDLDQAAAHMRRLARDEGLREKLSRRGTERIAGQPTRGEFGEGYAALLRTPNHWGDDHPTAFFDGLNAARPMLRVWLRTRLRGRSWPNTARR